MNIHKRHSPFRYKNHLLLLCLKPFFFNSTLEPESLRISNLKEIPTEEDKSNSHSLEMASHSATPSYASSAPKIKYEKDRSRELTFIYVQLIVSQVTSLLKIDFECLRGFILVIQTHALPEDLTKL
ncbi:unnamed protein product [Rhizopus stolonifer]